MIVTPHDIAALAETRRRDPALALSIADEAGKAHDQNTLFICRVTEKENPMPDAFDNWRKALAGEKQPIYEDRPWVGYFAVQDRSPGVTPAKGNRWPLIACAIFEQDGELRAERAGKPCPVEWVWPYAASRPITYEAYQFWHANGSWKQKESAA